MRYIIFTGFLALQLVYTAGRGQNAQNKPAPKKQTQSVDTLQFDQRGNVQTGLYVLPKRQLISAIGQVRATDIRNLVVPGVEAALQGKAAGVQVTQVNGMPGADVMVRVRGLSSIYGESEPLYVVDGVPIYAGARQMPERGIGGNWGTVFNPLNDLNVNDIQSVEVLKDAGAQAIYGSRAANGVILITTKNGQSGKSYIDVDYYRGVTGTTNRLEVLNGPEYLKLLDQAGGTLPTIPGFTRAVADVTNSDHLSKVLRSGMVEQASFATGYGNTKSSFYFSGSYRKEDGVLSGNSLTKYTGKIKVTNQLTNRISIGANVGLSYVDHSNLPVGNSAGGGFNAAQRNLPVFPWYISDGRYFYPSDPAIYNLPGTNVESFQKSSDFENEEQSSRVFIAANLGYAIIKGLDFRVDAALDKYYMTSRNYLSKRLRYGSVGSGTGREGTPQAYASYEKYSQDVYNIRGAFNYKTAGQQYTLTAAAGVEFYNNENPYFFAEGESFVSDVLRQPSSAAYRNFTTAASTITNVNTFLGYFGTGNLMVKEKYLIGATVRVDGSSRFGANQKYFAFPALSAGWIISKENFLKANKTINFLKLRASYGITGNAGIGNYSALERWASSVASRYLLQAGIHYAGLGSPDLQPEKVNQVNIGLDFSLANNRIQGTVDVYNRTTSNLLLNFPAPLSAGVIDPGLLLNEGKLRNRGVELSISSKNFIGSFQWSTEFNIAHNSTRLIDAAGVAPKAIGGHKNIGSWEGHAPGVYYLARYAGVDAVTGQEMIYDAAGNKVAATSAAQIDAARVPIFDKPSVPKWFGGINNIFRYKDFDLSAFASFSLGNYVLDEGERELSYLRGSNNLLNKSLDSWTPSNTNAAEPKLIFNDPIAGSNTTRFLHNASYLRMRNVTLGYSLNKLIRKSTFIKDIRVYASAQNLFTITSFPGWDPEVSGNYMNAIDRNLSQGIVYMYPPQVRTFIGGIHLNF